MDLPTTNATPLLSLTELGKLQRANSAASRLQALERLTGEQRPALGRSNTVATAGGGADQGSGVGGGLERRSVVGRRMMERLGNRVAARQQQQQREQQHQDLIPERTAAVEPPLIQLYPPSSFPHEVFLESDAQPRSASRQTARSVSAAGSDAGSAVFEYDSHLSRNASVRAGGVVVQDQVEQLGGDHDSEPMREGHRTEEVLVSPIRADFQQRDEATLDTAPPARYTLTDSGLSLGREIGDEHQQTPPRQTATHGTHHLASTSTPDSHHASPPVLTGTPTSTASSSMIPVMIPSSQDPSQSAESPSNPLLPTLGAVVGAPHARGVDRRLDSMSRFPQGVASGTGSSYGFRASESDIGGVHAWQDEQGERVRGSERGVRESEGYFEHFEVDEVGADDEQGDDARSDVTEKMGAGVGGADRPGSDSAPRSRRESYMSWEDVGDDSQIQRLPSEDHASSSGGVINRLEKSLRDTWRKHRASRDESISSATDEEGDRHLLSGRVTPLLNASTNTSTSNMIPSYSLLPGQTSPMPAADPHDVRLQNSKLSPFLPTPAPGTGGQFAGFTPGPLLQQASDSLVPTMTGVGLGFGMAGSSTASLPDAGLSASQSSSAAASYYDLSARAGTSSPTANEETPMRSTGAGVVGKKSWLAEAFFAGAQGSAGAAHGALAGGQGSEKRRPSLSDIMRRKPSILERYTGRREQREREKHQAEHPDVGSSRSAPAPPISFGGQRALDMSRASPTPAGTSPLGRPDLQRDVSSPRLASESPTVSTVLEAGDERSTVYHPGLSPGALRREHTDAVPDPSHRRPSVRERLLPGGPMLGMMNKLNAVLALAPDARPDVLDDPPRRLVMSLPVRQVVNHNTVKDRYLFLFSDILVIAKPLLTPDSDSGISLDTHFSVKSVVPLQHLKLTADQQEHGKGEDTPNKRHPIVQQFIDLFARDPDCAVELLEQKGDLRADIATLASVLFKTPELDKEQLGKYLCAPYREDLLRAFLERFHFGGLPIDQALRMFLLAIRMPPANTASENLLHAMADAWYTANASKIAFDASSTAELLISMVELNESLHPANSLGFAAFRQGVTVEEFVAASRVKDPKHLVPEELLRGIFNAIEQMPLVQSLRTIDVAERSRTISLIPGRLPSRLSNGAWSEPIKVCIPEPDPHFIIELTGNGLSFDPPELDFSHGTVASFRVKGDRLGLRTMMFRRLGTNAPCYGHLTNTHTFVVERSFMQHIFHLTFQNHLGLKRKYLYSLQDAETKANTFDILQQLIVRTREAKQNWKDTAVMSSASRQLADQISIKVLQSSLVATGNKAKSTGSRKLKKDVPDPTTPSRPLSNPNMNGSTDQPGFRQPALQQDFLTYNISPALEQTYRFDDSASVREGPVVNDIDPKKTMSTSDAGSDKAHTGKELVFICRQNSLLPVVLGFLRYGMPSEDTTIEPDGIDDGYFAGYREPTESVKA